MQPVDFTTLTALRAELQAEWLPSRLEQVYQRDRFTVCLALRTLKQRGWLTLSWHPQAARLGVSAPPPRIPDTFTFSQQLRHQLGNLALVNIVPIAQWERVLDLQFSRRPGEPALWHLYLEVMGKYSNAVLTNQANQIVTAAHQVSAQQSSVRPIQTGQPYDLPPRLTDATPSLSESFEPWHDRLTLIPGPLKKTLLKTYRGLSSALVTSMVQTAGIAPDQSTADISHTEWQQLFHHWQAWLKRLETQAFQPGWTSDGYTVMGWEMTQTATSVQALIDRYYTDQLNQQEFSQLRHQISQKLRTLLDKLQVKTTGFQARLVQSDRADTAKAEADLLMAHLQNWQPGMTTIALPDFDTGTPIQIALDPTKNAVQNAQTLYKRHQKLKRTRGAIEPLLAEVTAEMHYLEQIEAALRDLATYQTPDDLEALKEIQDELIQQRYLDDPTYRSRSDDAKDSVSQPYRYTSPSGFEVLVGRNNRQNDQLTFRTAGDYDLWFHTQEIPGSHVLLRLPPGTIPETIDLQFAADLAAFHSRARQSDQAPVVYTQPKHVYKPKGAKPGMSIYKQEKVLWGQPQRILQAKIPSSERFLSEKREVS